MFIIYMDNLVRHIDASNWHTTHCEKKVRQPSRFKLTHHTNNWEVGKLLILATVFPFVDVQPLGYGQVYIILSSHKRYDVIVGNYPKLLVHIFLIMSTIFLGTRGAWVQCKHLYHIL
jgi:hypothetical protein